MDSKPAAPAFSLVEVILAIGIFAVAMSVVLGLLPALGRQSAASMETLAAQRLPDAIRAELIRLAAPGFDALAAEIPVMSDPPVPGLALVAARDGMRLHSRDYLPPGAPLAAENQYYLVECWRFAGEPLGFGSQKAFLALEVRVSWPYRVPGMSGPIDARDRSAVTFVVSLRR